MPLKRTAQQREPHPHGEQVEVGPGAKQPKLEPVDEERMEPGRPHQAFVENEARKYWQDIMQVGSLTKPTREELRAAAMPILCQAQRRKTGCRPGPWLCMPLTPYKCMPGSGVGLSHRIPG